MSESPKLFDTATGNPRAGLHTYLTPTKKTRSKGDRTLANNPKQGY